MHLVGMIDFVFCNTTAPCFISDKNKNAAFEPSKIDSATFYRA